MAKSSKTTQFLAGLGSGLITGNQMKTASEERKADRAMRAEEHEARMDDAREKKKLRVSLADAARPVTVESGAGGAIRPPEMDNRDVGLPENEALPNGGLSLASHRVRNQNFATEGEAAQAAAVENSPQAVTRRQAGAYMAAGRPDEAMALQQNQNKATEEQRAWAARAKEEGVFDALRMFRNGDGAGMAKVFNQGGSVKLEGEPVMTKEERDVPGVGKIPTYNATLRFIGKDGKVEEKTYNSHDLSLQMMPYEKALELQRKGSDSDQKATYQGALIDAKTAALEAKTAAAGAKSAGAPSREERLRYTSLFTDAGRRAGEAQKAITALQKDPEFARGLRRDPNGPQAQQLNELRDSLKTHNEERGLYQGLLSGSQGAGKPSLADAKPKTGRTPAAPQGGPGAAKPDFSPLWK